MNVLKFYIFFCTMFLFSVGGTTQETAAEIIKKSDEKVRGKSSKSELKMTIVRPSWERETEMKAWSMGDEYSLILVTAPDRDKGVAFLKRDHELWNWQPAINRTIKMPPSMMMQSWMGSDFKNDDLVKESSIIKDYDHSILREERLEGRNCHVIELIPKKDAAVVWGKIITWIDKKDYLQLKSEMYDEEGYLVNTMYGKNIKMLGGKLLPSLLEVVPEDEEGHLTRVEYLVLEFDIDINQSFFSTKNLKRIR